MTAAERGYARSQTKIGAFYLDGVGVAANTDEGKAWIEKAAAQGEPHAEYRLGMLHLEGRGYPRDAAKAADDRQGGAREGWRRAIRLALLNRDGIGMPKNEPQALYWLRAAADQRQAQAEYLLAIVYRTGWLGAPRQPKQAMALLQRSAVQGHAPAQFDLGIAYIDGKEVKPDPQEAYGWLTRAARQGHGQAIEDVARIDARLRDGKAP